MIFPYLSLTSPETQFYFIPFDCAESFSCVLCTHREDRRESLRSFVGILKKLYADAVAFPL